MYFSVFPHNASLSGQFDFLEKGFVMIKLAIISDKRNTQVTRRSTSEGVFSHLTVCLSFIWTSVSLWPYSVMSIVITFKDFVHKYFLLIYFKTQ